MILRILIIALMLAFAGVCQAQDGLPEDLQVEDELIIENPLPVLFKAQVPPGSWSKTANCGQASINMALAYHDGEVPTAQGIMEIDDWLAASKWRRSINGYNSQGTKPPMLLDVAKAFGYPDSYVGQNWGLQQYKDRIDEGLPVVARLYTGYLKNRPYRYVGNHYVLVIGYTPTHIICNDPGGAYGGSMCYLNSQFASAVKKTGGYGIVVLP